jgi:hypothetical protein
MNLTKRTVNSISQRSGRFIQSENSALKYYGDYVAQLDGDTIASSTWTDETGGLTIASEAESDGITSALISGTPGEYRLVNKVTTTTGGETLERVFRIKIKDNNADYDCNDYGWHRC